MKEIQLNNLTKLNTTQAFKARALEPFNGNLMEIWTLQYRI